MIYEIQPNEKSYAYIAFNKIDYIGTFKVVLPKNVFRGIDDFAEQYFVLQPLCVRLIRMNIISKQNLEKDLQNSNFRINTNIGSWKIIYRDDSEIVFGQSMKFIDYRFSMRLEKDLYDYIEVSTIVKLNGILGRCFFSLIKPMHKKFVKESLEHVNDKFFIYRYLLDL